MLLNRKKDLDITNGPLFKTILLFALPIILSNVVTTLFNAADMAVLSAFTRGGNEVASVGATSSVISLFTQFAVGLGAGVNIILARLCGQGDEKNARRVISTAILTAAGMGLLLAVLGSLLGRTLLAAMNCPEECLADDICVQLVIVRNDVLAEALDAEHLEVLFKIRIHLFNNVNLVYLAAEILHQVIWQRECEAQLQIGSVVTECLSSILI